MVHRASPSWTCQCLSQGKSLPPSPFLQALSACLRKAKPKVIKRHRSMSWNPSSPQVFTITEHTNTSISITGFYVLFRHFYRCFPKWDSQPFTWPSIQISSAFINCWFAAKLRLTLTRSSTNTLATTWEIKCFSYGQFSQLQVLLTDICSSSLWHKLMHIMPIVCHLPWNLQVTRIIPSTTNSHNFQCKTIMSSNFNDTS